MPPHPRLSSVLLIVIGLGLSAATAHAAPLTYSANQAVSLTSPSVTLTIASGSVADSVTVNSGTLVVAMSSSTGGTFTITAPQAITTSSVGTLGTVTVTCASSIQTVAITQSTATGTYTLTPTGSACTTSSGGGGGGGGGSVPTAQLTTSESVDKANPSVGGTVNFTVTVTDAGPSLALGVVASDTLPSGLTFVSATSSEGTYANGTWTIGNLNANQQATLTLTATVNSGTAGNTISNPVTVSESNSVNNPLTGNGYTSATASISVVGGGATGSTGGSSGGGGGGGGGYSAPILAPSATTTSGTAATGTPSSFAATITALQAQLQALLAQAAASPAPYSFTHDLELWDVGPAVKALEQFLVGSGTGPAAAKLAVHGASRIFGFLTYNALREFQTAHHIRATGYFGPKTRAYVNAAEK
jgi:uncharacterized repeat protein (TIGR01451 family)